MINSTLTDPIEGTAPEEADAITDKIRRNKNRKTYFEVVNNEIKGFVVILIYILQFVTYKIFFVLICN